MPQVVNLDGGQTVEFPDTYSQADIGNFLSTQPEFAPWRVTSAGPKGSQQRAGQLQFEQARPSPAAVDDPNAWDYSKQPGFSPFFPAQLNELIARSAVGGAFDVPYGVGRVLHETVIEAPYTGVMRAADVAGRSIKGALSGYVPVSEVPETAAGREATRYEEEWAREAPPAPGESQVANFLAGAVGSAVPGMLTGYAGAGAVAPIAARLTPRAAALLKGLFGTAVGTTVGSSQEFNAAYKEVLENQEKLGLPRDEDSAIKRAATYAISTLPIEALQAPKFRRLAGAKPTFRRLATGVAAEAGIGFGQEASESVLQQAITMPEFKWSDINFQQAALEGLGGAIGQGLFKGIDVHLENKEAKAIAREIAEVIAQREKATEDYRFQNARRANAATPQERADAHASSAKAAYAAVNADQRRQALLLGVGSMENEDKRDAVIALLEDTPGATERLALPPGFQPRALLTYGDQPTQKATSDKKTKGRVRGTKPQGKKSEQAPPVEGVGATPVTPSGVLQTPEAPKVGPPTPLTDAVLKAVAAELDAMYQRPDLVQADNAEKQAIRARVAQLLNLDQATADRVIKYDQHNLTQTDYKGGRTRLRQLKEKLAYALAAPFDPNTGLTLQTNAERRAALRGAPKGKKGKAVEALRLRGGFRGVRTEPVAPRDHPLYKGLPQEADLVQALHHARARVEQIAKVLGVTIELTNDPAVHAQAELHDDRPATIKLNPGSIFRTGVLAHPMAVPNILYEELIHAAHINLMRDEWTKAGSQGKFTEYADKRVREFLATFDPKFLAKLKRIYKTKNDGALFFEYIRQLIQQSRTGQITEEYIYNFAPKVVAYVKKLVKYLKSMLGGKEDPYITQTIAELNKVLDVAEAQGVETKMVTEPGDESAAELSSSSFEGEPSKSASGAEATTGGANVEMLIQLLRNNQDRGNTNSVAARELIQNSVDAVRQAHPNGGGEIRTLVHKIDDSYYDLMVVDNGGGMSPQFLASKFLSMGYSSKGIGSGGGFGIAKGQVFGNAESFEVNTLWTSPDGTKYLSTLEGNPIGFMSAQRAFNIHIEEGVNAINNNLTLTVRKLTPEQADQSGEDGTAVKVKLKGYVWGTSVDHSIAKTMEFNSDIKHMTGNTTPPNPTSTNLLDKAGANRGDLSTSVFSTEWDTVKTIDTPQATVTIQFMKGTGTSSDQNFSFPVFSNSVYQFNKGFTFRDKIVLPNKIHINVVSKVGATEREYPFPLDRSDLKEFVKKPIEDFFTEVGQKNQQTRLAKYSDAFTDAVKIQDGTDARLLDVSEKLPKETMEGIAKDPAVAQLSLSYRALVNSMLEYMSEKFQHSMDKDDPKSRYAGMLSGTDDAYGVRFGRTRGPGDIYLDPFLIYQEAKEQADNESRPDNVMEYYAGITLGVIMHELNHQLTDSEGESMAREMTFKAGYLGLQNPRLARAIERFQALLADPTFEPAIALHNATIKQAGARLSGDHALSGFKDTVKKSQSSASRFGTASATGATGEQATPETGAAAATEETPQGSEASAAELGAASFGADAQPSPEDINENPRRTLTQRILNLFRYLGVDLVRDDTIPYVFEARWHPNGRGVQVLYAPHGIATLPLGDVENSAHQTAEFVASIAAIKNYWVERGRQGRLDDFSERLFSDLFSSLPYPLKQALVSFGGGTANATVLGQLYFTEMVRALTGRQKLPSELASMNEYERRLHDLVIDRAFTGRGAIQHVESHLLQEAVRAIKEGTGETLINFKRKPPMAGPGIAAPRFEQKATASSPGVRPIPEDFQSTLKALGAQVREDRTKKSPATAEVKADGRLFINVNPTLMANLSPEAQAAVMYEEIIHAAHLGMLRNEWIREGRPGSLKSYIDAHVSDIVKDIPADLKQEIQETYAAEGQTMTDQQILFEYIRQLVQQSRTGEITEKYSKGLTSKILAYIEKLVDFLGGLAGASPRVRQVVNDLNRVLDMAEGKETAPIPVPMGPGPLTTPPQEGEGVEVEARAREAGMQQGGPYVVPVPPPVTPLNSTEFDKNSRTSELTSVMFKKAVDNLDGMIREFGLELFKDGIYQNARTFGILQFARMMTDGFNNAQLGAFLNRGVGLSIGAPAMPVIQTDYYRKDIATNSAILRMATTIKHEQQRNPAVMAPGVESDDPSQLVWNPVILNGLSHIADIQVAEMGPFQPDNIDYIRKTLALKKLKVETNQIGKLNPYELGQLLFGRNLDSLSDAQQEELVAQAAAPYVDAGISVGDVNLNDLRKVIRVRMRPFQGSSRVGAAPDFRWLPAGTLYQLVTSGTRVSPLSIAKNLGAPDDFTSREAHRWLQDESRRQRPNPIVGLTQPNKWLIGNPAGLEDTFIPRTGRIARWIQHQVKKDPQAFTKRHVFPQGHDVSFGAMIDEIQEADIPQGIHSSPRRAIESVLERQRQIALEKATRDTKPFPDHGFPVPLPPEVTYLNTGKLLKEEGCTMGHCIAGYIDAAKAGQSFNFSVKTDEGDSTFEMSPQGQLLQHKGKRNSTPPNKNQAIVQEWLDQLRNHSQATVDQYLEQGDVPGAVGNLQPEEEEDQEPPPEDERGGLGAELRAPEFFRNRGEVNERTGRPDVPQEHKDVIERQAAAQQHMFDQADINDIKDWAANGTPGEKVAARLLSRITDWFEAGLFRQPIGTLPQGEKGPASLKVMWVHAMVNLMRKRIESRKSGWDSNLQDALNAMPRYHAADAEAAYFARMARDLPGEYEQYLRDVRATANPNTVDGRNIRAQVDAMFAQAATKANRNVIDPETIKQLLVQMRDSAALVITPGMTNADVIARMVAIGGWTGRDAQSLQYLLHGGPGRLGPGLSRFGNLARKVELLRALKNERDQRTQDALNFVHRFTNGQPRNISPRDFARRYHAYKTRERRAADLAEELFGNLEKYTHLTEGAEIALNKIDKITRSLEYQDQVTAAQQETGSVDSGVFGVDENSATIAFLDPITHKRVIFDLDPNKKPTVEFLQKVADALTNIQQHLQNPNLDPLQAASYEKVAQDLAQHWQDITFKPEHTKLFGRGLARAFRRVPIFKIASHLIQEVGGAAARYAQRMGLALDETEAFLKNLQHHKTLGDAAFDMKKAVAMKAHGMGRPPNKWEQAVGRRWVFEPADHQIYNDHILNPLLGSNQKFGSQPLKVGDWTQFKRQIKREDYDVMEAQKAHNDAIHNFFEKTIDKYGDPILIEQKMGLSDVRRKAVADGPYVVNRSYAPEAIALADQWLRMNEAERTAFITNPDMDQFTFVVMSFVFETNPEFKRGTNYDTALDQLAADIKKHNVDINSWQELTADIRTRTNNQNNQTFNAEFKSDMVKQIAIMLDKMTSDIASTMSAYMRVQPTSAVLAGRQAAVAPGQQMQGMHIQSLGVEGSFIKARGKMVASSNWYKYAKSTGAARSQLRSNAANVAKVRFIGSVDMLVKALRRSEAGLQAKLAGQTTDKAREKESFRLKKIGETRFTLAELRQAISDLEVVAKQTGIAADRHISNTDRGVQRLLRALNQGLSLDLLASLGSVITNVAGGQIYGQQITDSQTANIRRILAGGAKSYLRFPHESIGFLLKQIQTQNPALYRIIAPYERMLVSMFPKIGEGLQRRAEMLKRLRDMGPISSFDFANRNAARQVFGMVGGYMPGKNGVGGDAPDGWMDHLARMILNNYGIDTLQRLVPRPFDQLINYLRAMQDVNAIAYIASRAQLIRSTRPGRLDPADPNQLITAKEMGITDLQLRYLRDDLGPVGALEKLMFDFITRLEAAPPDQRHLVPFLTEPQLQVYLRATGQKGNVIASSNAPSWKNQNLGTTLASTFMSWPTLNADQFLKLFAWTKPGGGGDMKKQLALALLTLILLTALSIPAFEGKQEVVSAVTGQAPAQTRLENVLRDPSLMETARYLGVAGGSIIPFVGNIVDRALGGGSSRPVLDLTQIIPMAGFAASIGDTANRVLLGNDPGALGDFASRWIPAAQPLLNRAPYLQQQSQIRSGLRSARASAPSDFEIRRPAAGGSIRPSPQAGLLRDIEIAAYAGDEEGVREAYDKAVKSQMELRNIDEAEAQRRVNSAVRSRTVESKIFPRRLTDAERERWEGRMNRSQRGYIDRARTAEALAAKTVGIGRKTKSLRGTKPKDAMKVKRVKTPKLAQSRGRTTSLRGTQLASLYPSYRAGLPSRNRIPDIFAPTLF